MARYREQLDKLGFSYDWDRQVVTSDPAYYRWTQWAFLKMYDSYYDLEEQRARPVDELIGAFAQKGSEGVRAACTERLRFSAAEWNAMDDKRREEVLLNYRLAYRADTTDACRGGHRADGQFGRGHDGPAPAFRVVEGGNADESGRFYTL